MKREDILLDLAERLCNEVKDFPVWVDDEPICLVASEGFIENNSPNRRYWDLMN